MTQWISPVASLVAVGLLLCGAGCTPPPVPKLNDLYGDELPPHAVARLGTTRLRPASDVMAVALSGDGRWLASGSMPGNMKCQVEIWNVELGKRYFSFLAETRNILSLAWLEDGKQLVVSHSNCVEVWDVESGQRIAPLDTPEDRVVTSIWSVAVAPDQRRIGATINGGLGYAVWDARSWQVLHSQKLKTNEKANCLRFSPDSNSVLLTCDHAVRILRAEDGALVRQFETAGAKTWGATFSPDGMTVAAVVETSEGQARILLWDAGNGESLAELPEFDCSGSDIATNLLFSGDGETIVTSGDDQTLRFWDLAGRKLRLQTREPGYVGYQLAASADGKRVASGEVRLGVWDVSTGQRRPDWPAHPGAIGQVGFTPDGAAVLASSTDGVVRCWHTTTGQQLRSVPTGADFASAFALSHDGKKLAIRCADHRVVVQDFTSGDPLGEPLFYDENFVPQFCELLFTQDDAQLLSAGSNGELQCWTLATGESRRQRILDAPADRAEADSKTWPSASLSSDGRLLGYGRMGTDVRLYDIETGERRGTIPGSAHMFNGPFAWAPGGHHVMAPGTDETAQTAYVQDPGEIGLRVAALRRWDVERQREVWKIGPLSIINCLAVSPDGRLVAGGFLAEDEPIRIWSARDGKLLLKLAGHQDAVRDLAFSPDSRLLVSASQDATLLVWDMTAASKKLE